MSLWYRVPQGLGYLQTNYHMFILVFTQSHVCRATSACPTFISLYFSLSEHHLSHNNSSYNVFLDQKHLMIFYLSAFFYKTTHCAFSHLFTSSKISLLQAFSCYFQKFAYLMLLNASYICIAINGNSDKIIRLCRTIIKPMITVPIATDPSASIVVVSLAMVEL